MTTIDRSCCDVEDVQAWQAIGLASRDVSHYRSEARSYRRVARSWREHPMAGRPGEAEGFAALNDLKAEASDRMEAAMLVVLNGTILESDGLPGQVWDVKDWAYRVATPGNPCTCLGRVIPETPSEALNAIDSVFDDSWLVIDEVAERASDYSEMVHYNGR